MASKSGTVTLTTEELTKMRIRANLIPQSDAEEDRAAQLHMESQRRTDQWGDNLKDLKTRKEEQRYRKFEKEELQRRHVDREEHQLQQKIKEEELARANAKLFQGNEKVRALNSKLLYSDTLQGRDEQLQVRKYIDELDRKREQFYHEETITRVQQQEEQERKAKEQQRRKLQRFQKDIRKQHKEVKKQYIAQYKEEMEEGALVKARAEAAIRAEEEKQRARRSRNVQNRAEADQINQHNKQLKLKEAQKTKEEEEKIQEYRRKQEIIQDLTRKRNRELIDQKINQREELYKKQALQLTQVENNQVERLNSQIQELERKEAEIESAKGQQRKILKQQYEQSLKDQVLRKQRAKEEEARDNQVFKDTWKEKVSTLKQGEAVEDKQRRQMMLRNAEELKRQMDEKERRREEALRREFEEAEKARANIENQDSQFKSYAQKCLNEWEANGKNLYPIIKHLSSTMKQ